MDHRIRMLVVSFAILFAGLSCSEAEESVGNESQDVVSDNQVGEGPAFDFVSLLGKSMESEEVVAFTNTLGYKEVDNWRGRGYPHWMYTKDGVELVINEEENTLHGIFLMSEGNLWYSPYKGKLPNGLSWQNSREEVEMQLGEGARRDLSGDVTVQYEDDFLEIAYDTEDEGDMQAKMSSIQIRTF